MKRLIEAAKRLRAVNARHRKGFYLDQQKPLDAACHALEEIVEVIGALKYEETVERVSEEVGDVLGCLAFVIVELGVSFDEVVEGELEKLAKRYGVSVEALS